MLSVAKRELKAVLPEFVISIIKQYRSLCSSRTKRTRSLFDDFLLRICALYPITSSFYYALISSAFQRELHGVIYGKLKYFENLKSSKDSNYLIRRNIHRLEKGLIMKPRRDTFATDYIEETVNNYKKALQSRNKITSADSEILWAHDVLKEYFNVVASQPIIDRAREEFSSLEPLCSNTPHIPYKRDLTNPPSVSYDQFLELSYRRRSVRWYQQKPVPRELIDKAITAAVLSPSACNRQPFEFWIFDEAEQVQKVASIAGGTKGFSHNFPAIIVVVGQLSAYFSERDRHIIYIDSALASMALIYALETLGLSSCVINWPDVKAPEKQMASLLNLKPDERVIMLVSVGYPDVNGMVPYSQKKPLDQIRRYNLL